MNRSISRVLFRASPFLAAAALCACGSEGSRLAPETASAAIDSAPVAVPVAFIDSAIPPAVAGEDGWNFQQSAEADFTGGGGAARVVLTARVEMYRGRPAWDDGQPWQVYVETADGSRTYLYAQRLQLGTLTMRITTADSARRQSVVLIEHLPDRMRVIEASAPETGGAPRTLLRFERMLDPYGEIASPQLPGGSGGQAM
jgi:hypothetical protein